MGRVLSEQRQLDICSATRDFKRKQLSLSDLPRYAPRQCHLATGSGNHPKVESEGMGYSNISITLDADTDNHRIQKFTMGP
jgi:hypothetical protein